MKQLELFKSDESNADKKVTFGDMLDALGLSKYSPDTFGSALRHFTSKDNFSIKTLSLFSGAGGLDIGFKDAGFDIVEQNELIDDFAETLRINDGDNCKVVCKDVREYSRVTAKHLL